MPDPFRTHINSSLADPNLQAALDYNAERRNKLRQEAFTSLPGQQALRQRAHEVRAEVIANLDRYLEQFIAQVQSNGMVVHHAADAFQAVQFVLDIAHQNGAKLIAKSKSMLSEEINLNHALEAAGLQVVETDLGEYIVQLRGERPSHIITPAVHLRRADVGKLFNEKLGMPLTDDVPTMTNVARQKLRQVFLNADIGLSGINFGVAQTGTLCILTNEGNGRMVTTLPPVHIALMGIERLVPALDDLALMLSLLPRSGTGQKITVYASLIHGPRRPGDPDGSRERHLILVDNGRNALRSSLLAEALYCIRCGACLNACPVFQEIGGHAYVGLHGESSIYPGPIGSVLSPALFGGSEFGQLAHASSLCGACREACPVDIDLPRLLLRVRAGMIKNQTPGDNRAIKEIRPEGIPGYLSWGLRFYTLIATNPRLFTTVQRLAGFGARLLTLTDPWLHLPTFTRWGYSKDFPRPATHLFHVRWNSLPKRTLEATATLPSHSPLSRPATSSPIPVSSTPLITQFTEELTALGGSFTQCHLDEIASFILALLSKQHISSLLAWDGSYLPPGLLDNLAKAGIKIFHTPDQSARAGLTGALAAIAETGTLVLPGGPGHLLTASLLPDIHIAVIHAKDILLSLTQGLNLVEVRNAACIALVSGPSRTADIEMTLTIGVHGPKEVHVFCIDGSSTNLY
jgi:L-lactate dehydrogenase complex protein LldF